MRFLLSICQSPFRTPLQISPALASTSCWFFLALWITRFDATFFHARSPSCADHHALASAAKFRFLRLNQAPFFLAARTLCSKPPAYSVCLFLLVAVSSERSFHSQCISTALVLPVRNSFRKNCIVAQIVPKWIGGSSPALQNSLAQYAPTSALCRNLPFAFRTESITLLQFLLFRLLIA